MVAYVPAFCDNCGNIFPSGLTFENAVNVTLKGNRSQCPKCSDMAYIPDGIFNFYKEGIEVLEASEATTQDLQKFYKIIHQRTHSTANPHQDIQQQINKEVPKLSFLARYLPNDAKQLAAYLYVIGSLIGALSTMNIEINIENEQNLEIEEYIEKKNEIIRIKAWEID